MNTIVLALLTLAFAQGAALAQEAGDAKAGKALWEGRETQCRNCHGSRGQGAFGPDLAGRRLSVAHFTQALRKPWGIMPAYLDSQIGAADIANLAAYFDSLPVNAAPGKWRYEVPADAPRGQVVALTMGCAQCHGPSLSGPRAGMGAVDGDFDAFRNEVYHHTSVHPEHLKRIGERAPPRLRMGNFSPTRMWESQLHDIYDWAKDLGWRPNIRSRLRAGVAAGNGVTYALNVENAGLPDKAKTAEDIAVRLMIPAGTTVVATTGAGYRGVQADEKSKAGVAVWHLERLAPAEHQAFTITLSRAATKDDNLHGNIRWTRPQVKTGPYDQSTIAPAPLP